MSVWPHTVLLLAALAPASFVSAAQPLTAVTEDDTSLRAILDSQAAAWNRGDGDAWAAAFADDATFINVRGQIVAGHAGIAAIHRMILTGPYKGSHVEIRVRRILPLSAEIALVETDHIVSNFHALPPGLVPTSPGVLEAHMNYIARKGPGGAWQFVSAQNTAVLPGPMPLPPH